MGGSTQKGEDSELRFESEAVSPLVRTKATGTTASGAGQGVGRQRSVAASHMTTSTWRVVRASCSGDCEPKIGRVVGQAGTSMVLSPACYRPPVGHRHAGKVRALR